MDAANDAIVVLFLADIFYLATILFSYFDRYLNLSKWDLGTPVAFQKDQGNTDALDHLPVLLSFTFMKNNLTCCLTCCLFCSLVWGSFYRLFL